MTLIGASSLLPCLSWLDQPNQWFPTSLYEFREPEAEQKEINLAPRWDVKNTRSHSDLDMWNRLAPYVLKLFGRHGPSPVNGIGIEACHLNIVRLLSSVSNHIFVFSILLSSYQNQMLFRNRVEIRGILFLPPKRVLRWLFGRNRE